MAATELAVAPDPEDTEQMSFEGFPIKKFLFSLTNDKRLWTPHRLHFKQPISGTFEGVVKSFHYDVTAEGLCWVIGVDEADLHV